MVLLTLALLVKGKDGGSVLLRYTLQQQFQQACKQVHTDAWLEHSSTAGQRALQVGDDPKWVVIAASGLQRGAANVGAGGMMKKNLPVCSHASVCADIIANAINIDVDEEMLLCCVRWGQYAQIRM